MARPAILAGLVALAWAAFALGETGGSTGPVPSPRLGPAEVVRIQLEALRGNDPEDHGIAVCFRFASPTNKQATGPLEHFAQMIREGPYALMLHYRAADFEPIELRGDAAYQRVTLVGASVAVTYLFVLSRQVEEGCSGCCPGCWMTEAVLVERVERTVT